ncbi:MAG: hypothetical protein Kow0059_17520 [Candidatus Sumerlaeia bacterium]
MTCFNRIVFLIGCAAGLAVQGAASGQDLDRATTVPASMVAPVPMTRLLDKVVASAGDSLITIRDIDEDLRLTYLELGAPQPERFPRAFFEKRREELIERRLLYQWSEQQLRRDIPEGQPTLTPEMRAEAQRRVEQTMALIRSHYPDEAAMRADLARRGLTLDGLYQKLLREEEQTVTINLALGREIQLPAEEVRAYRATLQEQGKALERYRLRHILLPVPAQAGREQRDAVHIQALDIGLKIRRGQMTFEAAAREFSKAPGAAETGGDIGYVDATDLAPPIRQALEYLRPGQITTPIETPEGYHLFQMIERLDARDFLWDEKIRARRRAIVEEMKKQKRVELYEF